VQNAAGEAAESVNTLNAPLLPVVGGRK
jgi:hypothetical protein